MKRRMFVQQTMLAVALAAGFAVGAQAQTVLKFSHTDQPGGARQKAAEPFGQKVGQYT